MYIYIYKNLLKTKLARTYRKRSLPTNSKIAYKNIAAQRRVADGSAKKKKKKNSPITSQLFVVSSIYISHRARLGITSNIARLGICTFQVKRK